MKSKTVRAPIQVYLTPEERALLDQLAKETGKSRAQVLREGLRSLAIVRANGESPMLSLTQSLSGGDWPVNVATLHDEFLEVGYLDRERAY
jgi:hypothetical protein